MLDSTSWASTAVRPQCLEMAGTGEQEPGMMGASAKVEALGRAGAVLGMTAARLLVAEPPQPMTKRWESRSCAFSSVDIPAEAGQEKETKQPAAPNEGTCGGRCQRSWQGLLLSGTASTCSAPSCKPHYHVVWVRNFGVLYLNTFLGSKCPL